MLRDGGRSRRNELPDRVYISCTAAMARLVLDSKASDSRYHHVRMGHRSRNAYTYASRISARSYALGHVEVLGSAGMSKATGVNCFIACVLAMHQKCGVRFRYSTEYIVDVVVPNTSMIRIYSYEKWGLRVFHWEYGTFNPVTIGEALKLVKSL